MISSNALPFATKRAKEIHVRRIQRARGGGDNYSLHFSFLIDPQVPKLIPFSMAYDRKRLPAHFYRSDSGREPVREWLQGLDVADRKVIGEDIKDVEFSWPIGMPLVGALGRELWEVRSRLPHGRIARVLFCVKPGRMVLLHGFIKKTQKTPQHDLKLALERSKGASA